MKQQLLIRQSCDLFWRCERSQQLRKTSLVPRQNNLWRDFCQRLQHEASQVRARVKSDLESVRGESAVIAPHWEGSLAGSIAACLTSSSGA